MSDLTCSSHMTSTGGACAGLPTPSAVAPLAAHLHPPPVSLLCNGIHLYSMVMAGQERAATKATQWR